MPYTVVYWSNTLVTPPCLVYGIHATMVSTGFRNALSLLNLFDDPKFSSILQSESALSLCVVIASMRSVTLAEDSCYF
jgi:hypothetical protein